jgi:anti-sigma B factor antagonist
VAPAAASQGGEQPGRVMDLTLNVRPCDRGTIVSVSGEVDLNAAEPLQDLLLRVMRMHGPWLLLDLSGVSFIDCAGLRTLVLTRQRAESRNGSLILIAVSATVRRILDLAKMRHVFLLEDRWSDTGGARSGPPERAVTGQGPVPRQLAPDGEADEPRVRDLAQVAAPPGRLTEVWLTDVRLTDDAWVVGVGVSGSRGD